MRKSPPEGGSKTPQPSVSGNQTMMHPLKKMMPKLEPAMPGGRLSVKTEEGPEPPQDDVLATWVLIALFCFLSLGWDALQRSPGSGPPKAVLWSLKQRRQSGSSDDDDDGVCSTIPPFPTPPPKNSWLRCSPILSLSHIHTCTYIHTHHIYEHAHTHIRSPQPKTSKNLLSLSGIFRGWGQSWTPFLSPILLQAEWCCLRRRGIISIN